MTATITTILFMDIVRSTHLMQRIGDERAQEIFGAHHAVLRDALHQHGGDEVQWLGDGFVAAFSSASDAVACAIAMQQTTEQRESEHGLRIRVGINVGEILRDEAGCGYFGTPVVTASRLCDSAGSGEILCSATVAALLTGRRSFRFRDLGPVSLKGVAGPVPVCEVLYDASTATATSSEEREPPSDVPLPLPALLAQPAQFPFSGRRRELEHLIDCWKQATCATRRVILIEGEPGIGKTRLSTELARLVHQAGGTVLFGRCDEGMGVPYQPFVEALEHFVEHTPRRHLRQRLGRHAGEFARLSPEIVQRLPGLPRPLESDPATERYRLFDAVASWLAAATADRPILLVLDDLHWADTPTLLLFRHLVRESVTAPLLIVGTHRDTEVDRAHPLTKFLADLRTLSGVEMLPLGGLDEDGAIEFVEQASGHGLDEAGRGFARAVYTETAGNPFFIGEVLRHLTESGILTQRDGHWVADLDLTELGIPEAVRDVILRRVGRLSPEAGESLTLAAVIGREFDLGVLSAISPLEELPLLATLEEAVGARLVDETEVDHWRFAHALVRSALYDTLSASRGVRLHRRVGDAMQLHRPDDVTALAYHFTKAGPDQLERAIDYTTRSGDRALASLGDLTKELGQAHLRFAEAIDHTWRALLAGRLEVAEAIAAEAYEIGLAAGQADALTYYAAQLFAIRWERGRLGELVPLLEQVVAENPGIPAFRGGLALAYCEADRLDDACSILEAGLTAGFDDLSRDLAWTTGVTCHAEVCTRLGHRAAAEVLFEKIQPFGDHVVFNGVFVLGSLQRPLGRLASTLGRATEADACFARAERMHERLDAPALLARTHADWAESVLSREDADSARARELLERALSTARELGLAGVERRAKDLRLS